MTPRETNFIRATARGVQRAMDELLDNTDADQQRDILAAALAKMSQPHDGALKLEEIGYFATMLLAAHHWTLPGQFTVQKK